MSALATLGALGKIAGGWQEADAERQKMRSNEQLMRLRQMEMQDYQRKLQQDQQSQAAGAAALDQYFGQQQAPQEPQGPPQGVPPSAATPGPVQREPLPALPGGQGPAPGVPSGTAMAPLSIPSRDPEVVKGSWYGNYSNWRDPMDSGRQAGGVPVERGIPGIALPSGKTLGQQFDVTAPNGQTYRLPQTDRGPARWTGRGVDINAPAAEMMGYTPKNFPTDQNFKVHPVASAASAAPQQAQAMTQAGNQTAMQAGSQIPQQAWGMASRQQLWEAISKANPGASPMVKFLAFEKLEKMLAPGERQQFQMYLQQHSQDFRQALMEERQKNAVELAEMKAQLRGGAQGPAPQIKETPEGMFSVDPRTGQVNRLDVPGAGQPRTGAHGAGGLEGDILRQRDEERRAQGLPPMTAEERTKALSDIKAGARPPGRQAQTQVNAVMTSINETSRAITNLVDMGIGAGSGIFMGTQMEPGKNLKDSLFRSLGNTLTAEESQRVNVAFSGVARALANVESVGRATGLVALQAAGQQLKPEVGDAPVTILAKYAEIRQIMEAGAEAISASPDISDKQKEVIENAVTSIRKVVPWTVLDVNALARDPSDQRVSDFAKMMKVGGAADREKGGGEVKEISEEEYKALPKGAPYRVPGNPATMYKD